MAEKKQNVVFWKDQGPDDIIYVSPDDDLRTITSVTVPEHSVALFIRDGQLQGVLEPGRHVTTSSNIPWLTALYNKALGFRETPFKCSVVFISLKIFNGKWGLRSMIKAAKEYEVPITLMANGDFQFRIQDVNVFYTQVLGGMKSYSTGDVNQFMKSFITEQLTQQLNSQYYMDVMSNLEKASTSTKILIDPYFQQRGIELLALKINEVSTTEAEKTKVFEYLQFSSANGEAFKRYEVMDRMADAIGDSQGGAAMGAGMLLFPQMYQQLSQQSVQGVQQQVAAPQAQKVMCPYCGGLNDYPYKFCGNCGKPSPMMQNQQQVAAPVQSPAAAPAAAPAGGAAFKICPYCGQDLSGLKKTPKFCPYCSEQLV
ncbi:SPFH domain-containing protein [Methanomethylophilus alvi]|uniref:SPFH domain-containing protein n=1 Tax=Methanomethylophilus alvi TaxID=1291540 RepID=UPI0037DD469E